MFKFVENAYLSVLEREKEEKMELERARQLNQQLKDKVKRLENENSNLKEKFANNELDIITRKNDLNSLLEELQKERRANLETSQRLQISKEQLESINNFIDDLRPIKEQLNFKKSVTECLHDLLIKTKLRIAESEEVLQELHDYLTELEYEVEKTRNVYKHGVSHWQDEFLSARLREADVVLGFDKIKRDIATIKHELEEKKLIREAKEMLLDKPAGSSNKNSWRKNNRMDQAELILEEEDKSIIMTLDYQDEIDFLKRQVKKLEDQKGDCDKKIQSNEEIKLNLHEVRRSIWLREFETNQKVENIREKYRKLSEKMSNELEQIQKNIEIKDLAIARIEEKIKELQYLNDSLKESFTNNTKEDISKELEDTKDNLEKEIQRLKKT